MIPQVRMESSVAPIGEHGSVVTHRKASHPTRAAGGTEQFRLNNSSIFAILSSRSRLPEKSLRSQQPQ